MLLCLRTRCANPLIRFSRGKWSSYTYIHTCMRILLGEGKTRLWMSVLKSLTLSRIYKVAICQSNPSLWTCHLHDNRPFQDVTSERKMSLLLFAVIIFAHSVHYLFWNVLDMPFVTKAYFPYNKNFIYIHTNVSTTSFWNLASSNCKLSICNSIKNCLTNIRLVCD